MDNPPVARRTILALSVAGFGAVAMAGCASNATTHSTGDTSAPLPESQHPGTSKRSEAGDTSSAKAALTKLDDIEVGHGVPVKLSNGKPGIVTRLSSADAVCFSAICTHMGCTVAPKGSELDCPCHGSRFNIRSGAVLNGPAGQPLEKIAVAVEGGKVFEA